MNGADYNESLVWESPEGIKVKPFYDADDIEAQVGVTTPTWKGWKAGHSIFVSDEVRANKKALDFLEKGVESLRFVLWRT